MDRIAPEEIITTHINRAETSPQLRSKSNRRNYLLKKRSRRVLTDKEKDEIHNLTKQIQYFYFNDHKHHMRTRVKPGNNKSLWDAVHSYLEPVPLP